MGKARRQYNHRISHTACRTPPSLLSQQSCVQSTGLCWTCPSWVPPNSPKPQRWALSPHPFYRCCHRGLGKRGPRLRIPSQHRAQPRWQPRPVLSSPRHHCPSEGAWDPALVLRSLGRRRGSAPEHGVHWWWGGDTWLSSLVHLQEDAGGVGEPWGARAPPPSPSMMCFLERPLSVSALKNRTTACVMLQAVLGKMFMMQC